MKKSGVSRIHDDKYLFSLMVKDGLTRQELRSLIEHQPSRWGQFADQVSKLPPSLRGIPARKRPVNENGAR